MSTEQKEAGREVATVGETSPVRASGADLTPLERALERGLDVDVIERLVALQERREERDAEAAMAEALAGFQAVCPPIPKTATAEVRKNGTKQYEYHFAPLDKIAAVIRPHLATYGLSYVHDAEVDGNGVSITCTLQHVMGAKRTATFRGPIDTSGGKNPIQQVASAQSYGRRYSLINVLGLTTGDDDDGVGADLPVEYIAAEQAAALDDTADEAGVDKAAFCNWLGVESIAAIPVQQYERAKKALDKKLADAKEGS